MACKYRPLFTIVTQHSTASEADNDSVICDNNNIDISIYKIDVFLQASVTVFQMTTAE